MHAYIITGGAREERLQKMRDMLGPEHIPAHAHITLSTDKQSIGIDSIRSTIKRLMLKGRKAAVIEEAHFMTTEAQNALLKTLEEPPAETLFFLETSEPWRLMPTILSRCMLIHIPTPDPAPNQRQAGQLLSLLSAHKIGERLTCLDRLVADREGALGLIDTFLAHLRITLKEQSKVSGQEALSVCVTIRRLMHAKLLIMGNVSYKAALDSAFLIENSTSGVWTDEK